MKHKQKVKIARKLLSNKERLDKKPLFLSKGWEDRKAAIAGRVQRQQKATHERAVKRKKV